MKNYADTHVRAGRLKCFLIRLEPRELIEINGLLSPGQSRNEPEACISGIELRVEKLEDPGIYPGAEEKAAAAF